MWYKHTVQGGNLEKKKCDQVSKLCPWGGNMGKSQEDFKKFSSQNTAVRLKFS